MIITEQSFWECEVFKICSVMSKILKSKMQWGANAFSLLFILDVTT